MHCLHQCGQVAVWIIVWHNTNMLATKPSADCKLITPILIIQTELIAWCKLKTEVGVARLDFLKHGVKVFSNFCPPSASSHIGCHAESFTSEITQVWAIYICILVGIWPWRDLCWPVLHQTKLIIAVVLFSYYCFWRRTMITAVVLKYSNE